MSLHFRHSSSLCCCEYIDINEERNHILGCCCNCIELDTCFDRLVSCKRIPTHTFTQLMATVQDRIRLPWRGGATQIAIDSILPIFILPLLGYLAAQGVWMSVVLFTSLPTFLIYVHYLFMHYNSSTKFFCVWTLTSVCLIILIFEIAVVSLLDIRTDENIIFLIITILMLCCGLKTKASSDYSSEVTTYDESLSACLICRKRVAPRTYHCQICHVCVKNRDLHCAWLDCCIGERNYRWYMATLVTALSQLMLCSNLILTTACHPFKVIGAFMLPDDCSDVYFDVVYAVMFVTAMYCLLAMMFLLIMLLHECWLISIGMTGHEWRNSSRRICCGLASSRPYSKGLCRNWWNFITGSNGSSTSTLCV